MSDLSRACTLQSWKEQAAKELMTVVKHEQADLVFSRSPITGRCAYDGPGMLKPEFIRRKTPLFAGSIDNAEAPNIVGHPRCRPGTNEALFQLQRTQYEETIRDGKRREATQGNDNGLAAAMSEMARNLSEEKDGKTGESQPALGAFEILKRLREQVDHQPYTDEQAGDAPRSARGRSGGEVPVKALTARAVILADDSLPPATPGRSSRIVREVTPFARNGVQALPPATPNSVRSVRYEPPGTPRSAREGLPPATPRSAYDGALPIAMPSSARGLSSREERAAQFLESARDRLESARGLSSREGVSPAAAFGFNEWEKRMSRPSTQGSTAAPDGDAPWQTNGGYAFSSDDRPSTASSLAGIATRPSTGRMDVRPPTGASRPGTAGSLTTAESQVAGETNTEDLIGSDGPEFLAPLLEVDESEDHNVELMASLDIPPPSAQRLERRAYYLEGFSPRLLPPLTPAMKNSKRKPMEPPQVMVLETPPRSSCGERPLQLSRESVVGRSVIRPQCRDTFENKGKPYSAPKSKTKLPKQPALPKKQVSGSFYVGGKQVGF